MIYQEREPVFLHRFRPECNQVKHTFNRNNLSDYIVIICPIYSVFYMILDWQRATRCFKFEMTVFSQKEVGTSQVGEEQLANVVACNTSRLTVMCVTHLL